MRTRHGNLLKIQLMPTHIGKSDDFSFFSNLLQAMDKEKEEELLIWGFARESMQDLERNADIPNDVLLILQQFYVAAIVVVFINGSTTIKAGFAGSDAPVCCHMFTMYIHTRMMNELVSDDSSGCR